MDKGEKITILDLLVGTRPSREVTVPFEESGSLVSELLHVASLPQTSSAIIRFEPRVSGETLEPDHDEMEDMEPFVVEEMDGSRAFSPRPEFMAKEVMELLTKNLTGGRAFVEDPMATGPSSADSKQRCRLEFPTSQAVTPPHPTDSDKPTPSTRLHQAHAAPTT
ncbi:hypothetical protein FH972_010342 [Carpinus fangiana]|uniref:Uncharacterized protein n=1 Tax=Carpinus fangiana TaxID=176857 RepID=A0A660KQ03_9ROSI|nr:hypothetical protein FH972_010342 [Carpinus fangiana]